MVWQTITTNFGWNTISETYEVVCDECGKKQKRSVSTGFNDLAKQDYIAEKSRKLKEQAKDLDGGKETCSECLKKRLKKAEFPTIKLEASVHVLPLRLEKQKEDYLGALEEKYKGHIAYINDEEYVITSIFFWDFEGGVIAALKRINKRKPWLSTEVTKQEKIDLLLISEEKLSERKNAVERGNTK